jgi:TIR domain
MVTATDLFISHSSKDKAFAWRLRADLHVYGVKVWLDEEQLWLAKPLTPEIEKAIAEAKYLGLILSSNSAKSEWVRKECDFAQAKNIPILPILIERMEIPKEFADIIYADFTEAENVHAYHRAFHRVLAQLGHRPDTSSDLVIYRDGLTVGWENSSWSARCHEKSTEFVHTGRYTISVELRAFGGLAFSFRSGLDTTPYSRLQFMINGGHRGKQRLKVYVNNRRGNGVRTPVNLDVLPAKKWQEVKIPWTDLDAENTIIFKVNWSDVSGEAQPAFYINEILLVSKNKPQ